MTISRSANSRSRVFRRVHVWASNSLLAAIAGLAIMRAGQEPFSSSLTFPFAKELILNLGIFFIPFAAFVMVGAGNAVNFTDGLDGLRQCR